MERYVERILQDLTGDLRLDTPVHSVSQTESGYALELDDETLEAAAVIITVPAYIAAGLVKSLAPQTADLLDQIRYVSTGTISLAYRRDEFEHPLDGFGIVIPRSEKRHINAVTWTSTKFANRAPDDAVLIRVFYGGSRTPQMMEKDDEELEAIVREELVALMGVHAEPLFRRIYRWPRANPQYDVNHLQHVEAIEASLPSGIFVSGSPYRGIGLPDCVKQGEQVSKSAFQHVSRHSSAVSDSEIRHPKSQIEEVSRG
jgi:oxygen-dependent protoporphyrinogen oxidase